MGERFLRTPGTRAYLTNAPRQGREELLQPLPGCVSLFLFYPGVRFVHPRLISFRPAGAKYVTLFMTPLRVLNRDITSAVTERDSHFQLHPILLILLSCQFHPVIPSRPRGPLLSRG